MPPKTKTTQQEPEPTEVLVGEHGPEIEPTEEPRGVLATRKKYCTWPNCGRWAEAGTKRCPHHKNREV